MTANVAIDELIRRLQVVLAAPLNSFEASHGWSAESKKAAHDYFSEVMRKIDSGDALPPTDIVRGLDHWGVTGGGGGCLKMSLALRMHCGVVGSFVEGIDGKYTA